jgi:hypothetical protein
MRPEPDRRWPLLAADVALAGLVVLATLPIYTLVDARWRTLVLRLAAVVILGILLRQVHLAIARRIEREPASSFDVALATPVAEPRVDRRLAELESMVKAAVRSRQVFTRGLWPRLTALAGATLPAPKPRRLGRGPSLADLRAVIQAIERQR